MCYIKHFNSENLEMRINRFMQKCAYRGLMTVVKLVIIHLFISILNIGLRIFLGSKKLENGDMGPWGGNSGAEMCFPSVPQH